MKVIEMNIITLMISLSKVIFGVQNQFLVNLLICQ
jgi:hypothetical protein